jgi:hypothetical protein
MDVLQKYGYKVLHFFGVTDSVCSLTGLRKLIKYLKWEKTEAWTPINELGYSIKYGNYSLITINGEGHFAIFNKNKEVQEHLYYFLH